jgi:hypothetical protein
MNPDNNDNPDKETAIMELKIKPLGDHVLVEPTEEKEATLATVFSAAMHFLPPTAGPDCPGWLLRFYT